MKANYLSGFYSVSDGPYHINSRGRGRRGLFNILNQMNKL